MRIRSAHLEILGFPMGGPTITGIFCAVKNYAEKAELSKCSWYSKRKFGVTMHFSGFNLEKNTIHCFVFYCFVEGLLLNYLRKIHGYPQFSLWIPILNSP